jgi:hypothetical protein
VPETHENSAAVKSSTPDRSGCLFSRRRIAFHASGRDWRALFEKYVRQEHLIQASLSAASSRSKTRARLRHRASRVIVAAAW